MKLGIKSIGYIRTEELSLPYFTRKQSVKIDESALNLIPITELSGTFDERSAEDAAGIYREVSASASMPYDEAKYESIAEAVTGDYCFVVEDMEDNRCLVGTNRYRATMEIRREVDEFNKNVIRFEIKHKSPHGALPLRR